MEIGHEGPKSFGGDYTHPENTPFGSFVPSRPATPPPMPAATPVEIANQLSALRYMEAAMQAVSSMLAKREIGLDETTRTNLAVNVAHWAIENQKRPTEQDALAAFVRMIGEADASPKKGR